MYRFTIDRKYQEQYKKLLEYDDMDIKDIVIPKITKQFQDIVINYIDSFIEKHKPKQYNLLDIEELSNKSKKKEKKSNGSKRTNKK